MAAPVTIDFNICDNTQSCVAVCPMGVFDVLDGRAVVQNPIECTGCMKCVENCPEGAIEVD